MAASDKKNPNIYGMSYNSARDELFLVDDSQGMVRAMRVRDNAGDLSDLYRGPRDKPAHVLSVCHMSDSDTLLVCLGGWKGRLVALSSYGRERR